MKITEDQDEKLILRMPIDVYSFVMKRANSNNYMNRILICGQENCIQVTFPNSNDMDTVYKNLEVIFNSLFQRDISKKQMITEAYERHKSMEYRTSMRSKYTWKEQKKFNFNLRVTVVGGVKRQYENVQIPLFIVKF